MTAGMITVRELWRWPVKGMGGERLPSVRGGRVLTSESGVRIRILEPCPRGGVYARVLAGGRVPTGAELR